MYPQRAASRRRRLSVSAVPRLPRSRLPPHGIYHVITRGVARTPIFRDDADRVLFLRLLEVAGRGTGWDVHALCLMGNHYHLVVETGLDRLSTAMHRVNGPYAENFNARYDRSGHLFGDRFAARVIEDEGHLAATCRYVAANPVRAGLCDTAADWPWTRTRHGEADNRQHPIGIMTS